MSETGAVSKLFFNPVHPLNFPQRELLREERSQSANWPQVERVAQLYEDVDGNLRLRVCFSDPGDPGNIDDVRCYNFNLGRNSGGDPLSGIGSLEDVANECERQMKGILAGLHGAVPGADNSAH